MVSLVTKASSTPTRLLIIHGYPPASAPAAYRCCCQSAPDCTLIASTLEPWQIQELILSPLRVVVGTRDLNTFCDPSRFETDVFKTVLSQLLHKVIVVLVTPPSCILQLELRDRLQLHGGQTVQINCWSPQAVTYGIRIFPRARTAIERTVRFERMQFLIKSGTVVMSLKKDESEQLHSIAKVVTVIMPLS